MNEQSIFNSPGSKFLISFKGSNTAVASWHTTVFQVPPYGEACKDGATKQ